MKTEKIYLLEGREDIWLKSYLWEESIQLRPGQNRPAVIVLPGGGYLQAGDNEGEPVALKFASMGYHAFVLHYSTYNVSFEDFFGLFASMDGTPEQTEEFLKKYVPKKECVYPMPILDVGRAFLKIREQAEKWHVDMERIALCGFSAGAHNAAMYCTNWHTDLIAEKLKCRKEDLKPAALVLGYTLSDYTIMREFREKVPPTIKEFFDISNQIYLGTADITDEMAKKASPAKQVTEHMPPTFLWSCANDAMVPVQNTIRMAEALADQNIPFELHIFEQGAHGIGLGTQASASAPNMIFEDAGTWSDLAGKWLQKRFFLFEKEQGRNASS